jgi:hypothetical protein
MHMHLRRWLADHRFSLLATAIILAAAGLRVTLVAAGWPGTDSDEATMGLMAKHILTHGEHPIFFYGQNYMGSIEAYLGAFMYLFLGVSQFALKCGLIALFAAFMIVMYRLLSLLFSRGWALVGLALIALGSDNMLYHELEAWGGYLETIFFGAATIAIAVWLIRTAGQDSLRRWRVLGFGVWGLAAGLGIWSDPLVTPFVALTALLLAVTCWRDARGLRGAVAALTLLIGISPWIIYVASSRSPQAATSFLAHARTPQPAAVSDAGAVVTDHILGTVVIAIPNNTGANAFCPLLNVNNAWPPAQWTTSYQRSCMLVRGMWGSGFIVLLLVALAIEGRAFWSLWRSRAADQSGAEREQLARRGGRLAALGAPAATMLFFAISSASMTSPWIYGRYLISTLIALPVLLGALGEVAGTRFQQGSRARKLGARLLKQGLPAVFLLVLAAGVFDAFGDVPAQRAQDQQQAAMIHLLIRQGDTRIFADYWTCMRIMFQSNERIYCSILNVADGRLVFAPSRYRPYDKVVAAAPYRVYVFPVGSAQAAVFPQLAAQSGWQFTQSTFANQYVIFAALGPPATLYPVPASQAGIHHVIACRARAGSSDGRGETDFARAPAIR